MRQIIAVMRKELQSSFGSPLALIFIGSFLLISLFSFFWIEAFFARGIADLRPLFIWMPILLIFLVAALTMRQWSEEQHAGTLEMLLTLPIRAWKLVLAKFLATFLLVALALALTLGLPITVANLGNLDWGPVLGGYLAALLLAAAYIAIGLFVSAQTDNQIVALIITILMSGAFYLLGASNVLNVIPSTLAEVFRGLGTGSRFESIERGVIDLRDLLYYLSLCLIFLLLNMASLERKRWGKGSKARQYRLNYSWAIALGVLNLLLLNIWLFPLQGLRADITQNRLYSLSEPTKDLLASLQEPLLIRAYISDNTHPLLAPLAPQVADLLREYEIVSGGRVQAEVLDPQDHPELEAEANQSYGIRPRPFQVADRYETTLVNAYFDILVRYGDQAEVLSFDELIEIVPSQTGNPDVRLRNLEYDLTRTIKKNAFGFQSLEAVFASLDAPARLNILVTPETLPSNLEASLASIEAVATDLQSEANGQLLVEQFNPREANAPLDEATLSELLGIQPLPLSLFSNESYYLHMLLEVEGQIQAIYPFNDMNEASVREALEASLKRAAPGFLKTVGVWSPPEVPTQNAFGQQIPPLYQAQNIRSQLAQSYTLEEVDLSQGQVPNQIDVLLLLSPRAMSELERYALDQFLMRGGSLVVATGSYVIGLDPFSQSLMLEESQGGINDLLAHYGISVGSELVMDPQNARYPEVVQRNIGGVTVQEVRAIDYPFFISVLPDGMAEGHPSTASLPQVTLMWASPLSVNSSAEDDSRLVDVLLSSTAEAWLRTDSSIQPNFEAYPLGFPIEGERASQALAVAMRGSFESFYDAPPELETSEDEDTPLLSTISKSPDSTRLVVISSAEAFNDLILNLASQLGQDRSRNNLQFLQNAIDWSVEDADLLSIRSRGAYTRVLAPLSENQQRAWELANYLIALLALIVIAAFWQVQRRRAKPLLGGEV